MKSLKRNYSMFLNPYRDEEIYSQDDYDDEKGYEISPYSSRTFKKNNYEKGIADYNSWFPMFNDMFNKLGFNVNLT